MMRSRRLDARIGTAAILVAFGGWLLPSAAIADDTQVEAMLGSAIAAYESASEETDRFNRVQQFARAAQLFQQICDGDDTRLPIINAPLLVNLGNARLQSEDIGAAIVAYRKALALDAQHEMAREHLELARGLVPIAYQSEAEFRLFPFVAQWLGFRSMMQMKWIAALLFALAAGLWLVGSTREMSGLKLLAVVPGLAWVAIGIAMWGIAWTPEIRDAVIVAEADVFPEDSENGIAITAQPLPGGVEVNWLEQRDSWVKIQFGNQRVGWVPQSKITHISD